MIFIIISCLRTFFASEFSFSIESLFKLPSQIVQVAISAIKLIFRIRMQIDGWTIASASVSCDAQSTPRPFFVVARSCDSHVGSTFAHVMQDFWLRFGEFSFDILNNIFRTGAKIAQKRSHTKTMSKQEYISALCRIFFMNDIGGIIDCMSFTNQLADTNTEL